VTSLGGAPVRVDELGIDACYSGTQKCLGARRAFAHNLERRAIEIVRQRKTQSPKLVLDLSMIEKYWGSERVYHHTADLDEYRVAEALRIVLRRRLGENLAAPQAMQKLLFREMQSSRSTPHRRADDPAPMITQLKFPTAPTTPDPPAFVR